MGRALLDKIERVENRLSDLEAEYKYHEHHMYINGENIYTSRPLND